MKGKRAGLLALVFVFTLNSFQPVLASVDDMSLAFLLGGLVGAGAALISTNKDDTKNVAEGLLTVSSVDFAQPGVQNLIVTHLVDSPAVVITQIKLASANSSGVTLLEGGDIPAECQRLDNGSSCSISLQATDRAYGEGQVELYYDSNNSLKKAAYVVEKVGLALYANGVIAPSEVMLESEKSPQVFKYKNTGSFHWQQPSIEITDDFATEDNFTFNFTMLNGCNVVNTVAPGGECEFSIATKNDVPSDLATLTPKSDVDNAVEQPQNFVGGDAVMIVVNQSEDYHHLGYRSLKIVNVHQSSAITISDITADISDENKVEYCLGNESCASFTNTPATCTNSKSLAKGEECFMWFKANKADGLVASPAEYNVEVTASVAAKTSLIASKITETETFGIAYDQALYYSGTEGETSSFNKWDGTNAVTKIAQTTMGKINALTLLDGDIYFGLNNFEKIGSVDLNSIAAWGGGTRWSNFGIRMGGPVHALKTVDNYLYAAGAFNFYVDAENQANNIAKWDGSSWSRLGGGLSFTGTNISFAGIGEDLYVGGDVPHKIEMWDGLEWDPSGIGSNIIGSVNALEMVDVDLYVGGSFAKIGSITFNNIAKWGIKEVGEDPSWQALGIPPFVGVIGTVHDLSSVGNNLNVGGTFSVAGSANITQWDGSIWLPLSIGVTSPVLSLAATANDLCTISSGLLSKWNGNSTSWSDVNINQIGTYRSVIAPSISFTGRITSEE